MCRDRGEPLRLRHRDRSPRRHRDLPRIGNRSLICAPLTLDGEVTGVLSLLSREPDAFDELALETTRLMAEFVSTVFRTAAELEDRQRMVEALQTQGQVVKHMQMALWVWARQPDGDFRLPLRERSEAAVRRPSTRTRSSGKTLTEVVPGVPEDFAATFPARDRRASAPSTS